MEAGQASDNVSWSVLGVAETGVIGAQCCSRLDAGEWLLRLPAGTAWLGPITATAGAADAAFAD